MQLRKFFASIATLAVGLSLVTPVANAAFNDQSSIPSWATSAVDQLVADGVISGYADGRFGPNDALTRAQFAKIAVLASNTPVQSSVTDSGFPDVPANHWAAPYVKAAKDAGIIGGYENGNFGPNDTVTRGQAGKILVGAFGLATHTEKGPNFPDVPSSAWEYPYVETAYYWSVINGYQNGNFGPSDPVTRAQVSVMTVNAQNPVMRSEYAGGEIPSDVLGLSSSEAMSSTQVRLMFNMNVSEASAENIANYSIAGLEITNATLAADGKTVTLETEYQISGHDYTVMISGVMSSDGTMTIDSAHDSLGFVGYVTAISSNSFTASVSPSSPSASSIPANANNVPYLVINFTAGSEEDVKLTKVIVERRGLGLDSNFSNIYLYDGATRLTNGRKFSSENHTATFNLYTPIVVPAGRTKSITVTGTMDGTSDQINYLQVAFPEDLIAVGATSGGAVTVSGNFPIRGAEMTTVNVAAGSITVDNNGTVNSSAKVGENAEFGLFKLTASNEDVLVTSITVENKGSGDEDIENIMLKNDLTGDTLATVAAIGANSQLTFDLTSLADGGLYIKKGDRALLSIKADVVGARSTSDKIDFKLDNTSDVIAIGQTYGYGVAVTNNLTYGFSQVSGGVTIEATDLVFDWEKPANTDVADDQNDVVLGILNITNRSEDILMKDLKLLIGATSSTGAAIGGGALSTYIDNIELVDPSGIVVAGPTTPAGNTNTLGTTSSYVDFTDNWLIPSDAGTQKYTLRADLKNTLSTGEQIQFRLQTDSGYFDAEGNVTGNTVDTTSNVTPASGTDIDSDIITVKQSTLTLALASTPGSNTYVAGTEVNVLGVTLTANDVSDIKVTKMIFTMSGSNGISTAGTSAKLYTDDGALLSEKTLAATTTFDSFFKDLIVPKGGQVKLIIEINSSSAATNGSTLYADITASNSTVTAQDGQGNSLGSSQISGGQLNASGANVYMTLITSGTLTVKTDDDTPRSDQVVLGAIGREIMKVNLTAANEDIYVKKLRLSTEANSLDNQISKLYLYDGTTLIGEAIGINTNGDAAGYFQWVWSGTNRPVVPKDGEKVLSVKADLNVSQIGKDAVAGSTGTFRLTVAQIESEGAKADITPTLSSDLGLNLYASGSSITAATTSINLTGGNATTTYVKPGMVLKFGSEYMAVEDVTTTGATTGVIATVVRGINGSTAAAITNATASAAEYRTVSNYFIPYDTLPTVALASDPTYGSKGAPTANMKVFGFTISAANNSIDTRAQKVRLDKLRLQVSGNAAAADFNLYDAADDSLLAAGTGARVHGTASATYILFDLSAASAADTDISENSSKSYYVKADVQSTASGGSEDSIAIAIGNLGSIASAGTENTGDIAWSAINTSTVSTSSDCVRQSPSDITPSAMSFSSLGGSADVDGQLGASFYLPSTGSTTVYAYFPYAVGYGTAAVTGALTTANFGVDNLGATVTGGTEISAVSHTAETSYAVITLSTTGAGNLTTGSGIGVINAFSTGSSASTVAASPVSLW